ncbi:MAG: glutathione S-transferase N-terminal domain-containing protein [Gammaproteobacteria bacterium]|nr:glutathione S-transferase N-terminal domain-containing protein [Gammaproteobacteria bacterium]MDH5729841.1 glutathione S-transferase N-terminal domain-containing protein [Gammaproteobacteria bacterium]
MAVITNKRSVMTLYSGANDCYSHRARLVLAEKSVTFEVFEVEPGQLPEDLIDLNPYNTVPTLVDRDLVLYDSRVIMEYLDERFPHPPLMPVDPVSRARSRLMLHRIDSDWYTLLADISSGDSAREEKARSEFKASLTSVVPIFEAMPYFMSEDFSLIDCCVAPLMWRLNSWGIDMSSQPTAIQEYAARLFERPSFQSSMTETEKTLNT